MSERPILFSGPMVRAILDGRKTQTRRVVKPQPPIRMTAPTGYEFSVAGHDYMCPYGKTGDRLWLRETWKYDNWTEDGEPFVRYKSDNTVLLKDFPDEWVDKVEDIWANLSERSNIKIDGVARDRRWRPSIHMPRWASRINLEITGVRVERLNDISRDDAVAEGVDWKSCPKYQSMENFQAQRMAEKMGKYGVLSLTIDYVGGYQKIWESINGPGSWDANPWAWVVEFKRVS